MTSGPGGVQPVALSKVFAVSRGLKVRMHAATIANYIFYALIIQDIKRFEPVG